MATRLMTILLLEKAVGAQGQAVATTKTDGLHHKANEGGGYLSGYRPLYATSCPVPKR